ncbi:ac29 [Sucra jujuba nucleopolyhedrovirus]|uniref:Ac29 n=1 Tax=Sucra jujuba nucleopolyhedrovirus TaxID=1563660 RepID=A0A097P8U5_9ABAC|nr:ac29 [Sucra jujuba nucleopolyhedrovirus]AIU41250.1 ac29 [Sucra jujuba nucleopolyhedrovirus]
MPSYYNQTYGKSDGDVRRQYNQVLQAKRQLEIQTSHLERLKKITKDQKELARIDQELRNLRTKFLTFGVEKF